MKTKTQRQQEAIERKRLAFTRVRTWWQECAAGSQGYAHHAAMFGKEDADRRAEKARQRMLRAAAEAHIDIHGNPL
jgi:hypothetical protein